MRKSPLGQSTEEAPSTAPTTSSSLKVLKQLGSDAHSEAFVAQVRGFDSPMVVRVVRPELAVNTERMNRFIAEARQLTEVSSPALLQVRSAGRMKDGPIIEPLTSQRRHVKKYIPPPHEPIGSPRCVLPTRPQSVHNRIQQLATQANVDGRLLHLPQEIGRSKQEESYRAH